MQADSYNLLLIDYAYIKQNLARLLLVTSKSKQLVLPENSPRSAKLYLAFLKLPLLHQYLLEVTLKGDMQTSLSSWNVPKKDVALEVKLAQEYLQYYLKETEVTELELKLDEFVLGFAKRWSVRVQSVFDRQLDYSELAFNYLFAVLNHFIFTGETACQVYVENLLGQSKQKVRSGQPISALFRAHGNALRKLRAFTSKRKQLVIEVTDLVLEVCEHMQITSNSLELLLAVRAKLQMQ